MTLSIHGCITYTQLAIVYLWCSQLSTLHHREAGLTQKNAEIFDLLLWLTTACRETGSILCVNIVFSAPLGHSVSWSATAWEWCCSEWGAEKGLYWRPFFGTPLDEAQGNVSWPHQSSIMVRNISSHNNHMRIPRSRCAAVSQNRNCENSDFSTFAFIVSSASAASDS